MRNIFYTFFLALFIIATNIVSAQDNFQIFTCDTELNAELKSKDISEIDLIRFEINDNGVTLDQQIPSDWTWIAGKYFEGKNDRIDFFFWNGMFYTNSEEVVFNSYRMRTFPDSFTDKIEANTFVLGFQKEDKGVVFAATEEAKEVYIRIDDSIMGREMIFNFHLDENEAKMFRITRKNPPFLP